MNKKILFVANSSSIHTVRWVDYFIEAGYDVYLATFDVKNTTRCKRVFFMSNSGVKRGGGNYHYVLSTLKLAKIISTVKPNYLNAHYSYSMGFLSAVALLFTKVKVNFSIVCHGSDILVPPLPMITNKLNAYALNRADKIFSVSDSISEKIFSIIGQRDNVFNGQYGVDIQLDASNKNIDIISNRAYTANSRLDYLLEALEPFMSSGLKIIFIMPGVPDAHLKTLKHKYRAVTFYETVEYTQMLEFINRSKIYISATKSDGSSLSLLESLASKTIPLVSNIQANRSWVLDGVNGFLFNSKTEFRKKLDQVLELDSEQIDFINLCNRKLIENKANYLTQMQKIEAQLNSL